MKKPFVLAAGMGAGWMLAEWTLRRKPELLPLQVQVNTGRRSPALAAMDRFGRTWQSLHVPDRALGYRYRANLDVSLQGHPDFSFHLRTNARGLRNGHPDEPVAAVLVGDSFALGYGVEELDTWAALLGALSGAEVANLGVGGFGSIRVLRLLQAEGMRLQPRLVLWQFFEDDFLGAGLFRRWLDSGEPEFLTWQQARYSRPWPAPAIRGPVWQVRRFLSRHVVSYEALKALLRAGAYGREQPALVQGDASGKPMLLDLATHRTWTDRAQADVQLGWQETQRCLLAAQALVAEAGAHLAVVAAPAKEAVYWQFVAPSVRRRLGELAPRNGRLVAEFCRRSGIPCLDLYEPFTGAGRQGQRLYFRHDAHWNAAGHRLAAQAVGDFIERQGWLP